MPNPSASILLCIQDATTRRFLRINADGSLNANAGAAAATTPSTSEPANIADGTNLARVLIVNSNGSVSV